MSASFIRTFTDADVYHAAISDAQTEGVITGRGIFRAKMARIQLDQLSLQRAEESMPRVSYSAIDLRVAGIVFPTHSGFPVHINGLEASRGDIIVYRLGSTGHDRTAAACQWGAIALSHEDLAAAGKAIVGRELTAPSVTHRIKPPPSPLLSRLLKLHQAAGHLAETVPEFLALPEVARAIDQTLLEAMVACLSEGQSSRAIRPFIPSEEFRLGLSQSSLYNADFILRG